MMSKYEKKSLILWMEFLNTKVLDVIYERRELASRAGFTDFL